MLNLAFSVLDRLIALALTLTLAVPAIVQPPCCCAAAAAVGAADIGAATAEATLPPCCRVTPDQGPSCPTTSPSPIPSPTRCGCDGCLSAKPVNPLAETASASRGLSVNDLPPALDAGPSAWSSIASRGVAFGVLQDQLSANRPPPDRRALFCVWVI